MLRLKESKCATFTLFFSLGLISSSIIISSILYGSLATATSDSVVDEINITVPISCSLTGTGMNTHNAEIPNGTYTADIGTTTLKAYCNDNEGFAIYAAGYTGNEIGGTNSNKLVGTAASSNATIVTGTATSAGNPDISNWTMKLNTVSNPTPTYPIVIAGSTDDSEKEQGDPDFSTYTAVPNAYTKVAYRTSATDIGDNAEGATLTTTYAAYISKTQAADTYSGQVIYTLVHPIAEEPAHVEDCSPGNICYNSNSNLTVGTMVDQSVIDNDEVMLYPSNFSRIGYGFAGWSDVYDYITNPDAQFYGPMETITVPEGTSENGLSLYAVWIPSEGSLQDSAKVLQLCDDGVGSLIRDSADGTAGLSNVTALTDQRDNQTYAIAKLADGNCWMIENLRLENTAKHNSDGSWAQGYDSSFVGLANSEFLNFYSVTNANSLYSIDGSTEKTISGEGLSQRFPRYNNYNSQNRAENTSNTNVNTYSYGNYYSWHAAIADTTYYDSDDHGTTSICPTGWRLPIGSQTTNDKSFGALSVALGGPDEGANANSSSTPTGAVMSTRMRRFPNNFVYSGLLTSNMNSSAISNRGSFGYYWTSTANSDSYAYYLVVGNATVNPGIMSSNKYGGRSIRCVVAGF